MSETKEPYIVNEEEFPGSESQPPDRMESEYKGLQQHFAMVWEALARCPVITPLEMRVYVILASYRTANTKSVWPGQGTVAKHCGMSQQSVSRGIKGLVGHGIISCEKVPTRVGYYYEYRFNDSWEYKEPAPKGNKTEEYPPASVLHPPVSKERASTHTGEEYSPVSNADPPGSRSDIQLEVASYSVESDFLHVGKKSLTRERVSAGKARARGEPKPKRELPNPMAGITPTAEMVEAFEMYGVQAGATRWELLQQRSIARTFEKYPEVDVIGLITEMLVWAEKECVELVDPGKRLADWAKRRQKKIDAQKAAGTYRPTLRSVGKGMPPVSEPLVILGDPDETPYAVIVALQEAAEARKAQAASSAEAEAVDAALAEVLGAAI